MRSLLLAGVMLFLLLVCGACGIGLCVDVCESTTPPPLSLSSRALTLGALEIDDSEITLVWQQAEGGIGQVEYSVYFSESPNLLTVEETLGNGALAGRATQKGELSWGPIAIDRDYYFNVIATDEAGKRLAYEMRSPFCGGAGVSGDEYLVCDAGSLQYMRLHLAGEFRVSTDLDLSGTATWNSGKGFRPIGPFSGRLDGGGFTLSGLTIARPSQGQVGLFSSTTVSSSISRLELSGVSITGSSQTGALIGFGGANVSRVWISSGSVSSAAGSGIGGLAGALTGGTVSEAGASVSVSGGGSVGGLVGTASAPIASSFAEGSVTAAGIWAGGLVGIASSTVTNCFATGMVSGTTRVGGLVGELFGAGPIVTSYAAGNANGTSSVGGLVGTATFPAASVDRTFATGTVAGASPVGGLVGDFSGGGTISTSRWLDHAGFPPNCYEGGNAGCTMDSSLSFYSNPTNYGVAILNWDLSLSGAWTLPTGAAFPSLRWQ